MLNKNRIITPILALAVGTLVSTALKAQSVDTVCFGTAPAPFESIAVASGSLGDSNYIYEWQDSISGGSWANAPGANSDTIYQAPALTETTYYRRKVRVLLCQEDAYSNVIEVQVLDPILSGLSGVTNANCDNSDDGSASLNPSGGLGNFQYLWDNGETGATATNLDTGMHSVTITDDFGCQQVETVDIGFDHLATDFSFEEDTVFIPSEITSIIPLESTGGFSNYLWSDGSTDSVTFVDSPGYYSLTVTDDNGCLATDSVYVFLTVGIADGELSLETKIYPNPTRDELNVMVGDNIAPDRVEIRTLEGKVMMVEQRKSYFNVSGLPAGVYIIDVSLDGRRTQQRLVIQ